MKSIDPIESFDFELLLLKHLKGILHLLTKPNSESEPDDAIAWQRQSLSRPVFKCLFKEFYLGIPLDRRHYQLVF